MNTSGYTLSIHKLYTNTTRLLHNRIRISKPNCVKWSAWTTADSSIAYWVSDLKSCTITQNAAEETKLTMGSVFSGELSCSFSTLNEGNITSKTGLASRETTPIGKIDFINRVINVQSGFIDTNGTIRYADLGYYIVKEATTEDDWATVSITAYDAIGLDTGVGLSNADVLFDASKFYNASGVYTNPTITTVITSIASELHTSFFSQSNATQASSRTITEKEMLVLDGTNRREALGLIAGLIGCNARLIYDGRITLGFFKDANFLHNSFSPTQRLFITPELQHQSGFKQATDVPYSIVRCTSNDNTVQDKNSEDENEGEEESTETIEDKVFTACNGTIEFGKGITFSNSIITTDDIKNIAGTSGCKRDYGYMGKDYYPGTIEWRGNPRIEAGDIVTVLSKPFVRVTSMPADWNVFPEKYYTKNELGRYEAADETSEWGEEMYTPTEYTFYVGKQTLDVCGGLKSTMVSPSIDEIIAISSTSEFAKKELVLKVKRTIESELDTATEKINGTTGGYISILDLDGSGATHTPDGSPDNIFISDIDVVESDFVYNEAAGWVLKEGLGAKNVIRINQSGIGISHSESGEAGTVGHPYQIAITGEGINATVINTGLLNADLIRTGKIVQRNNEGEITGLTYFDLEQGELSTSDSDGLFRTVIKGGTITQYNNDKRITEIAPMSTEDNSFGGIYFDSVNATGLSFGYIEKVSGRDVSQRVLEIRQTKTFADNVLEKNRRGGTLITENPHFAGFIHRRIQLGSIDARYEAKFGVGDLSTNTTKKFTFSGGSSKPTEGSKRVIYNQLCNTATTVNTNVPISEPLAFTSADIDDEHKVTLNCIYSGYNGSIVLLYYNSSKAILGYKPLKMMLGTTESIGNISEEIDSVPSNTAYVGLGFRTPNSASILRSSVSADVYYDNINQWSYYQTVVTDGEYKPLAGYFVLPEGTYAIKFNSYVKFAGNAGTDLESTAKVTLALFAFDENSDVIYTYENLVELVDGDTKYLSDIDTIYLSNPNYQNGKLPKYVALYARAVNVKSYTAETRWVGIQAASVGMYCYKAYGGITNTGSGAELVVTSARPSIGLELVDDSGTLNRLDVYGGSNGEPRLRLRSDAGGSTTYGYIQMAHNTQIRTNKQGQLIIYYEGADGKTYTRTL